MSINKHITSSSNLNRHHLPLPVQPGTIIFFLNNSHSIAIARSFRSMQKVLLLCLLFLSLIHSTTSRRIHGLISTLNSWMYASRFAFNKEISHPPEYAGFNRAPEFGKIQMAAVFPSQTLLSLLVYYDEITLNNDKSDEFLASRSWRDVYTSEVSLEFCFVYFQAITCNTTCTVVVDTQLYVQ